MFHTFLASGFLSLWYWALCFVLWGAATYRTLGVPYDMLLRASRNPILMRKVNALAHIHARRVMGIARRYGVPLALGGGFALAALFGLATMWRIEAAQAALALLTPLAMVALSTHQIAADVNRRRPTGSRLVSLLVRRRFWHRVVATLGFVGALTLALLHHPAMFDLL